MRRGQKIRYALLSILYALTLGYLFATEIVLWLALFTKSNASFYQQWISLAFPILILILTLALGILLIQIARVWLSLERTLGGNAPPYPATFWSWQTNLQFWMMLLLILGVLAGFLVR